MQSASDQTTDAIMGDKSFAMPQQQVSSMLGTVYQVSGSQSWLYAWHVARCGSCGVMWLLGGLRQPLFAAVCRAVS